MSKIVIYGKVHPEWRICAWEFRYSIFSQEIPFPEFPDVIDNFVISTTDEANSTSYVLLYLYEDMWFCKSFWINGFVLYITL